MAKKNWTKGQKNAIDARRGTVLVSAAAGSGKTAVLVQRIIERLIDPENASMADRLLVVTFTKSAAAQMKDRVEKVLDELIRKEPKNSLLKRQKLLVSKMNISTIHSFCSKLAREYFYLLDIAPDFRIISDKQREEFMLECARKSVENAFEKGDFFIADLFSSEKNDRALIEIILNMYNFSTSHIFYRTWLANFEKKYEMCENISHTAWGELIISHSEESLARCQNLIKSAILQLETYGDDKLNDAYLSKLIAELEGISALKEVFVKKDWDEIYIAINSYILQSFRAPRGYAEDALKIRISDNLKEVKSIMAKIEDYFYADSAECKNVMGKMHKIAGKLNEMLVDFADSYDKKKLENKLADYADLEHWTIKLLLKEEAGKIGKTDTAREIAQRFDEVMIDEYQDTNEVQDQIFNALSENNKFMVGDLKQCIYSFRQAMPEIFLGYKDKFDLYDEEKDSYPAAVILDRNFRSRDYVIDCVNFVFSALMTKESCGLDYSNGEALVTGADYAENDDCKVQIDFIEKEDTAFEHAEARHIANTIKSMIKSGFKVSDEGNIRPARYEDFCILIRNANTCAHEYEKVLNENQVPCTANVSGDFFSSIEVLQVLSFLRIIDNPNQDIPLLSLLLSPVYGFTPDDIAKIRVEDKRQSLYSSLINAAKQDEKFEKVIKDLSDFRLLAATMPSSQFIDYFYGVTGYFDIALAMEDGQSRVANLRKLSEQAREYENAGYINVSDFIKFVDRLKQNNSVLMVDSPASSQNTVKIMSIHKSKGLEFPVCIVAAMGKQINFERNDLMLNSKLGLGIKLSGEIKGVKFSNFIRDAISIQNNRELLEEEMRILYVAMTRAKEKLIMVASIKNLEKEIVSKSSPGKDLSSNDVMDVKSVSSWILHCALRHPDGAVLRRRAGIPDDIVWHEKKYSPWEINYIASVEENPVQKETESKAQVDTALMDAIREKIQFKYPYAYINDIPAKVTATMLSEVENTATKSLNRPAFLSEKGMTAAERGIAMHDFMQFADFKSLDIDLEDESKRLVSLGFITKAQAKAVDVKRVKTFLNSRLGQEVLKSKKVFKEQRFTVNINAKTVRQDLPENAKDEMLILQGAIDCAFLGKDNRLHIIDFKTDRIDSLDELVKNHALQLNLYKKALSQISDYEIGKCFLYSFFLGDSIEIKD